VPPGGYFGKALVVDVTDGPDGTGATGTTLPLPDEVLRAYLGGAGLGTWLLYQFPRPMAKTAIVSSAGTGGVPRGDDPPYPPQGAFGPRGTDSQRGGPAGTHGAGPHPVDPLGPEAPLAFVFSPLVGTPLTTSAKFAVVAKSPLTGLLTDALASSQFAISGKLTGYDAIVIIGRAAKQSVLLIDGDGARLTDADDLGGLTAQEADVKLRDRLGRGWRVAAIGPAGERGVRYATISHDGRHAGRGGLGAVMGAKNLKAVAVRAATKVASADPGGVLAAARDLRERSFGPATAKYRELGTLANLLAFNAISALPTRNFTSASFEGADRFGTEQADTGQSDQPDPGRPGSPGPGQPDPGRPGSPGPGQAVPAGEAVPANLAEMRRVARSSCASCTIGCEHIYRVGGGKRARVEYENVFALGPMCGVAEPGAVLAASARCDELGIDTISAGGTIAWAMECAERGLIDAPWLRFGDSGALLRALDEIGGMSTPLGRLLAQGSRAASETVGGGSGDFAPHVKGLEMPGYEPRTLHAMALGLAVNARGADHNRSGAYEADLSGDLDRTDGGAAHVTAAIETEDRAAVMDSMILCKFLRGVFTDPFAEWASLLAAVTGWDLNGEELRETARRIVLAKRTYNLREGWRPEDDWLPPRLLEEPLTLASGREVRLTPARLRAMIDGYYKERGLDSAGRPTAEIIGELHLE
jgi:aldehyde:ferredoxin oxidoreductase